MFRINVSAVIRQEFLRSIVARLAEDEGIFNIKAFARKIQPRVEKIARKPVSINTINSILSRYLNQFRFDRDELPVVKLDWLVFDQPNQARVGINKKYLESRDVVFGLCAALTAHGVPIIYVKRDKNQVTFIFEKGHKNSVWLAFYTLLEEKRRKLL